MLEGEHFLSVRASPSPSPWIGLGVNAQASPYDGGREIE